MEPLNFGEYTQVGPQRGSNSGGLYEHNGTGKRWYMKHPSSDRQGHNEIIAAECYREMGFDAPEYRPVDNGMVASRYRDGLPESSDPAALRNSSVVQEAFLPSALIANWDVIGLVYDNCLYDPETMSEPVFIDFGGSFDTRAMGGAKRYSATEIPALDGFTDPSINQSAYTVFKGMEQRHFEASKERVRSFTSAAMDRVVGDVPLRGAQKRRERMVSRRDVLTTLDYGGVL